MPTQQQKRPIIIVATIILSTFLIIFIFEPYPQPLTYHNFADQRALLGTPNVWDVMSNLPYLIVALLGLHFLWRARQTSAWYCWLTFFLGLGLVSLGSAYYHWAPSNATLFWDRLPMTLCFMGFFAAILTETTQASWEKRLLIPAILLGIAAVSYWHLFDDLRFYAWVQFAPLLCLPIILLLLEHKGLYDRNLLFAFLCYIFAKIFEAFDPQIFELTQQALSGHTVKHLISSGTAVFILIMLKNRLANSSPNAQVSSGH